VVSDVGPDESVAFILLLLQTVQIVGVAGVGQGVQVDDAPYFQHPLRGKANKLISMASQMVIVYK